MSFSDIYNGPPKYGDSSNTLLLKAWYRLEAVLEALGGGGGNTTYTPSTTVVTTSGTVTAGKRHIEFILSSDFTGSINGATIAGSEVGVYSPGDAPNGGIFAAMNYVVTTGSLIITTF